jgi:copper resistance protein B
MTPKQRSFWIVAMCALLYASPLYAADSGQDERAPYGMAMHDDMPLFHLLMEEFEYRAGGEGAFQWEGQAWYGNDSHKLWLKSEGKLSNEQVEHGRHEILYDRPFSTFFDLQAGLRADIDDDPGRGWFAFGVQGLAPYFFDVSATAYAGSYGRFAVNAEASFDLLLTQRLILQPKAEIDIYTKSDAARGIGSGLSEFEGGVRLRYEITRKFAPYVGLAYDRKFGSTKRLSISIDEDPETLSLLFGIHAWI